VIGRLLNRGLIVGLCAGLLAGGFAKIVGEPQVNRAIAFENQRAARELARAGIPGGHLAAGPVSRRVQSTGGLLVGTMLYGLAFGGLFALAFAAVYGRLGRGTPEHTAILLAASGFVVVTLVPFLKYPANPPSVGSSDTIGHRTELYLAMIAISVAAAVSGIRLARLYRTRLPRAAPVIGVLGYVVLVVGAALILPGVNEVARDFPAVTLWRFRIASLGTQLVLWSAIGLGFGVLAARLLVQHRAHGDHEGPEQRSEHGLHREVVGVEPGADRR
jgi:predicted cobalt transporter CbtA